VVAVPSRGLNIPRGARMGWNDHVDWLLNEEIEDLVAEGELEGGTPAYGIAQRVGYAIRGPVVENKAQDKADNSESGYREERTRPPHAASHEGRDDAGKQQHDGKAGIHGHQLVSWPEIENVRRSQTDKGKRCGAEPPQRQKIQRCKQKKEAKSDHTECKSEQVKRYRIRGKFVMEGI
jgi:hypothetical protein